VGSADPAFNCLVGFALKADDIDARGKKGANDLGDGCLTEISWVCLWVCKNKKRPERRLIIECLAERTGLEPATPGVTGRYSNQLNYRSAAVQQLF